MLYYAVGLCSGLYSHYHCQGWQEWTYPKGGLIFKEWTSSYSGVGCIWGGLTLRVACIQGLD